MSLCAICFIVRYCRVERSRVFWNYPRNQVCYAKSLEKYMGENVEGKRKISMLMTVILEENLNFDVQNKAKFQPFICDVWLPFRLLVPMLSSLVHYDVRSVSMEVKSVEELYLQVASYSTDQGSHRLYGARRSCICTKVRRWNVSCAKSVKFVHLTQRGFKAKWAGLSTAELAALSVFMEERCRPL